MMMVAIRIVSLYLGVALVSGGIAILGNQLGRKIGRRKMSVFGMRPRHTSIFITTITGILIAWSTLTVAAVFSRDVRAVVTGIQTQVRELEGTRDDLIRQVAELKQEVEKGTVIWNIGENLAIGTIPANTDLETVQRVVTLALTNANLATVGRMQAMAKVREWELPEADSIFVTSEGSGLRQKLTDLAERPETVGFYLVVQKNCFFKDEVPVGLEYFPVDRVFKAGEVIADLTVPEEDRLSGWYIFLEQVRHNALRAGMREFRDSLGAELTQEDLAPTFRQISTARGPVRLVAKAKENLYESSPLSIEVEVEYLR